MSAGQTLIILLLTGVVAGGVGWYVYENYYKTSASASSQNSDYAEGATIHCTGPGTHGQAIAVLEKGKFRAYANMDVYGKHGSPAYKDTTDCEKFQWGDPITS